MADDAHSTMLTARIPRRMTEQIDDLARACGMSRSAVIREILAEGLRARDFWPPRPKQEPIDPANREWENSPWGKPNV